MTITLWAGDTAIHFLRRIRKSAHFFYVVEVENIDNSGIDYNMKKLTSPHGTNVLRLDENYDFGIKDGRFLKRGHIVVNGEREKGVVGFVKNDTATDAPIVEYNGYSVRLNFKERRRKRGAV